MPYQRISNEKFDLIVSAIDRGDVVSDIAAMLNVNVKTVYAIRRTFEAKKRASVTNNARLETIKRSLGHYNHRL